MAVAPGATLIDQPPSAAFPWHEVLSADGTTPREPYEKLLRDLDDLPVADRRTLEDRMDAVLREMGVTFDVIRNDPWGRQPWRCDLLPHIFDSLEWEFLVRGFRQRLQAFELFLADVYGPKRILRAGAVPIQAVLGSPHYQLPASGLPRPLDAYLHLSGLCIRRDKRGHWQVKHHHFSHATGVSYMLQNRRALARVLPELFQDVGVHSLAEMPLILMERLRETAAKFGGEPTVVLLSPGAASITSSEQSFIARRMGIPVVEGGDLLVLDDCVYLKTVRGLERVEVIYNRVADAWLDPLVFRSDSLLGVPGLVHCLRKGTVALVNAVGAQLADDRSLLAFAPQIIRFYLGEAPLLPTTPTHWLGDLDQREMVLENLSEYRIRPIFRENASGSWERALGSDEAMLRAEIRKRPSQFVAQPRDEGATTICFERGQAVHQQQDHILFAARTGSGYDVFPGALTRVFSRSDSAGDFGLGWTSKDSWVLSQKNTEALVPTITQRRPHMGPPTRKATSRTAESFYWMGRYLERAHHQAYLISVIETLETEELNSAERRHYQPIWNRMLPPLEKSAGRSRRSITTRKDRYRLVLSPEPGSVMSTFYRAVNNATSVQDSISPEAWATMTNLRSRFQKTKYRDDLPEAEAARVTRRLADFATQLIPQFVAVSSNTMLADDAWRFCLIGLFLERAIITANSVYAIQKSLQVPENEQGSQALEIELSAFLRLVSCRDAYRRIYQMRAEPAPVLELLWQQAEVPRSVMYCLNRCSSLLRESIAPEMHSTAPEAIEALSSEIKRVNWRSYVRSIGDDEHLGHVNDADVQTSELQPLLSRLLDDLSDVHGHLSDSFLNHQAHISRVSQGTLAL